jgi:hypothetical protein
MHFPFSFGVSLHPIPSTATTTPTLMACECHSVGDLCAGIRGGAVSADICHMHFATILILSVCGTAHTTIASSRLRICHVCSQQSCRFVCGVARSLGDSLVSAVCNAVGMLGRGSLRNRRRTRSHDRFYINGTQLLGWATQPPSAKKNVFCQRPALPLLPPPSSWARGAGGLAVDKFCFLLSPSSSMLTSSAGCVPNVMGQPRIDFNRCGQTHLRLVAAVWGIT